MKEQVINRIEQVINRKEQGKAGDKQERTEKTGYKGDRTG